MDWIISFMLIHLVGYECNRLQTISLILTKSCTNSEAGCIGGNHIRQRDIRNSEYWGRGDGVFKKVKCFLLGFIPMKLNIGSEEIGERHSDSTKVLHETTIITS